MGKKTSAAALSLICFVFVFVFVFVFETDDEWRETALRGERICAAALGDSLAGQGKPPPCLNRESTKLRFILNSCLVLT